MNTFISMLRGINVSGQKKIRMAELKAVYESLNFTNVTTYVQSGNVVFDSPQDDPVLVAKRIEAAITRAFGYTVTVFIRRTHEFQQLIAGNPFVSQRYEDPAKLHVTFLSETPTASDLSRVTPESIDEFLVCGKEIYLFCPNGYGRTKFSTNFFEKQFSMRATTRNWKTVTALYTIATTTE